MSQLSKTPIGKPEKWLVEAGAEAGLDLSLLTHEITDDFITHTLKQHGCNETEKLRGQLAVTSYEIALIPDIVKNPDCVIIGIKKYREIHNAYLKRLSNKSIIYFEEILFGKKNKSLRSKTMYIKIGIVNDETFFKIVSNSANTDLSNAKMVVGAGGNPGGET